MPQIPSFEEYLSSLGHLTVHVDPTVVSSEGRLIKQAAADLEEISCISISTLAAWVEENPNGVLALGLAVGLSHEKLKNALKHHFGTSGWVTLARNRPIALIRKLNDEYDLVRLLQLQLNRPYDFGDVLVARAGTRATATRAGKSGRRVEDEIEAIAQGLELPYQTRTRFIGRNNRTAPCDLVVPNPADAAIAVAAKGFDSTGSKLTDAVREIQEMAEIRKPRQFIYAVIDGIGWKSRAADLRRIYDLWKAEEIDGMYTLASMDRFREELSRAARLRGYEPNV